MNALETVLNLALVRSKVVREVDAELGSHHGLSLSDFALLLELHRAPGQRLRRGELANRLGVTPSGVARQLGPLERMGVVGREPHDRDARLALVVLTTTGLRVVDEALPTAEVASERALEDRWTATERERLGKLLGHGRS